MVGAVEVATWSPASWKDIKAHLSKNMDPIVNCVRSPLRLRPEMMRSRQLMRWQVSHNRQPMYNRKLMYNRRLMHSRQLMRSRRHNRQVSVIQPFWWCGTEDTRGRMLSSTGGRFPAIGVDAVACDAISTTTCRHITCFEWVLRALERQLWELHDASTRRC